MKFLIVGLGNPGPEYHGTRHNVGFQILDALAGASGISFAPGRYADTASFKHKGRIFILVKPNTFMNLSGKAVRYWMQEEDVPVDRLLVVADDLALPFGKIRLRGSGGAGGHNGLSNIIELIGTDAYARLRFGIGHDFSRGKQSEYVLGTWNAQESETLHDRIELADKAILQFGLLGIDQTMSGFNKR